MARFLKYEKERVRQVRSRESKIECITLNGDYTWARNRSIKETINKVIRNAMNQVREHWSLR